MLTYCDSLYPGINGITRLRVSLEGKRWSQYILFGAGWGSIQ